MDALLRARSDTGRAQRLVNSRARSIPTSMAARGLYRELVGEGGVVAVLVQYDKDRFAMPEALYRQCGYEPPFEDLPWKHDDAKPAEAPEGLWGAVRSAPRRPLFRT